MDSESPSKPAVTDREADLPAIIPAVELTGTPHEKLRTLDAVIARLQRLRSTLLGEPAEPAPKELRGRYINAPVWPWFTAGWVLGARFVLLLLLAYSYA